jgi:hypothetical protein
MLFGSLNILGGVDPTYGFRITAYGNELDFGNPEAVFAAIQSQLMDGDLERIDRFGNKIASIPIVIDTLLGNASPGDAIARGQAALENACPDPGTWTTLSWTSPLAGAQTSVLEVITATVTKAYDDVTESSAGQRHFTLTIHARPFVRPTTPVTIDAIAGSTTNNVDNGSVTTNWSLLTAQPSNGTNLVTNPSFETNTTGWAAGAGTSSISQDAVFTGGAGNFSLSVVPSGSGTSYVSSSAIAATAGTSYKTLISVSCGYSVTFGLKVRFYSDAGGTVQVGSDVDVSSGTNAQLTNVATAPTGTLSMRVIPSITSAGPVPAWYLDAVSVTASTWAGSYFDGSSTSSTGAVTYAWTGTANASTSTATVTARTLAVVSGMVKGTIYSSNVAAIRRTGAVSMTSLPYMKIVGVATGPGTNPGDNITLTVADNGTAVSVISSGVNPTTGAFTIVLNRPAGFTTSVDVTATYSGAFSVNNITTVAVDSIDITDNPWPNGATKTQTLTVGGSQRTEMSLLLKGLDAAGTTAVALGNESLVYTASAGTDGRTTFGSARGFASRAGTADATAISGSYDTLGTTAAPTEFTFATSVLLPGNYLIYARIKAPTVVTADLLSYRAKITPSSGDAAFDPRTGWKTAPVTAVDSGAAWPTVNTNTWTIVPLGMLRLPPVDVQDSSANLTLQVAKGSTAVTLDDLILCNADIGQASLIVTATSGGSYSAARLDAATVSSPQALCWVGGSVNGVMLADGARWFGEQHQALPGLVTIGTVTPGCTTTRVSGTYYVHNAHDVAAYP